MAMLPHGSDRDHMKQILGWAPRPTHQLKSVYRASPGQTLFNFSNLLNQGREITEVYVAVDGVMMMENHDYSIDMTKGRIQFDNKIHRLDGGEEIEVRTTGPDVDPMKRVLLLARKNGPIEFSDEDLQEMAEESIGAIFEVDQIAKYGDNAQKLAAFAGKQIQVLSFEVTEEGLIGTGQRVIVT